MGHHLVPKPGLAGTRHCQLVLLRQLVHTQNGDDVLHGDVGDPAVTHLAIKHDDFTNQPLGFESSTNVTYYLPTCG